MDEALEYLIQQRAHEIGEDAVNREWIYKDPIISFLAGSLEPVSETGKARKVQLARYTLFSETARRMAHVLEEKNIPVLFLKGIHYTEEFYKNPLQRPMQDIDFLVRETDFPRAALILQEAGMRLWEEDTWYSSLTEKSKRAAKKYIEEFAARPPDFDFLPGEITMVAPSGVCLDLHWHLSPNVWFRRALKIDLEGIWERVHELESGFRTLSPADALAYSAYNQCRNGYKSLFGFIDMDHIIRRYGSGKEREAFWQNFLAICKTWQTRLPAYLSLRLLQALCGTALPDHVLKKLSRAPLRRLVLSRMVNPKKLLNVNRRGLGDRHLWIVQLLCLDRVRDIFGIFLTLALPPVKWLEFRYGKKTSRFQHLRHVSGTIIQDGARGKKRD